MHWAVILAGGSGTRFWPLSTPDRPKQLLPLAGAHSTAEDALLRLSGLVPPERILIVTSAQLADPLARRLPLPRENFLAEPQPRSTGPALAWAATEIASRDPEAVLLSLHADWHVPDPAAFARVAARALAVAEAGEYLVTVGIVPTRPDPGFGYIEPGEAIAGLGARRVAGFTEKPAPARAAALIAAGALWNSGLFAWQARTMLHELHRHTPEIAEHLGALVRDGVEPFFSAVESVAIDNGLLERSDRVAVVPGDFTWDDIGTWEALSRVRPVDADGNVVVGPVTALDSSDNVVWSEDLPVVVCGVSDLVIVSANGRILVMHRSKAGELKRVLDQLPEQVRAL
jgi:mannose-1-phosphate guanylyltransferase